MNPFQVLDQVQQGYRKYVESFQFIASPDIPPVLKAAIESGELLWKEPFVQIWFETHSFSEESRAVKMDYRNMADGSKDRRTFYVYRYGFSLKSEKTVKSLTLPDNVNVRILAITMTQ